jgi:hypothetical protein
LDAGDGHGVWGATTPRERRAMAVVWRDEAPVAEAAPGVLGEVVILASQRQPIIAEALNHAVRVAS